MSSRVSRRTLTPSCGSRKTSSLNPTRSAANTASSRRTSCFAMSETGMARLPGSWVETLLAIFINVWRNYSRMVRGRETEAEQPFPACLIERLYDVPLEGNCPFHVAAAVTKPDVAGKRRVVSGRGLTQEEARDRCMMEAV